MPRGAHLLRVAWTALSFYALPALLGIALADVYEAGHSDDFDANVWAPAQAVLHGMNPYPPADLVHLVGHRTFVYPPVLLWFDIPLSVLGHDAARIIFVPLSILAVAGGLWLLGIRDHRCYACVVLSVATLQALVLGNPTILLFVVLCALWRWRDQPWLAASAAACAVAVKPQLWPIGLWLLATRRFRATGLAVGFAVIALFTSWAAIGFDGFSDYPSLVRLIGEKTAGPRGLSIANLVHALGATRGGGRVVQLACGLAVLGLVPVVARRADGDRRAFALALVAALLLSPVAWLHYLALLFVPLAVERPSYDRVWSATRLLWAIAFVQQGAPYFVTDGGRIVGRFGFAPTIPRITLALAFIAAIALVTGTRRGTRIAAG